MRGHVWTCLVAGLVLAGAVSTDASVCGRPAAHGRVERVVDGDTVIVRLGELSERIRERVRLLRINTPEKGRRGHSEATAHLESLVAGREITLEWEADHLERDNHGRVLAYVCVGSTNANLEQVSHGWSQFWSKYGRGRLAAEFDDAEARARGQRRGRWAWTPAQGR